MRTIVLNMAESGPRQLCAQRREAPSMTSYACSTCSHFSEAQRGLCADVLKAKECHKTAKVGEAQGLVVTCACEMFRLED